VNPEGELLHGTCVALGENAAILTGPSGSGKSDLALRFILETPAELHPALVSDDQTCVEERGGTLMASAPPAIAGKMEVRGLGILDIPCRAEARLRLIVRLAEHDDIPRLPPSPLPDQKVCGVRLPVLTLAPFEASAHLKLRLAFAHLIGEK
jgi:serine kinase of HPr protein (carbohydrate metabolism regulator)